MTAEQKLKDLGITLPTPMAPVANYVPHCRTGNLVSISGQIPMGPNGITHLGTVGAERTLEDGIDAAHICGINIIAQIKDACGGDLSRVKKIVKLGGFVNCVQGYGDQPKIINGASDLMVAVFGDKGRHSRSAVGVPGLPLGVTVEIDALVEIE
ncbi:MAG: RidA family protein [Sphingomonadales bacterium]|jgi:enamine deaminase RidA (YjgF/YER057c/UK114 family)